MRDQTDPRAEEAPAEMREAARNLRGMYVALRAEGFTEEQAITIIGQVLSAGLGGGGQ